MSANQSIAIFGATSAIAQAAAKIWASESARLFLVGRDSDKLQAVGDDLRVRGAQQVTIEAADLNDFARHVVLVETMVESLGTVDIVLIAHGLLPDQEAIESDIARVHHVLDTNFRSTASLLTVLADRFEKQESGTIAVISSVAGDRGRRSNYIYGSAMAAKTAFLSGLRGRMLKSHVQVLTIKPGFVDSPMTSHIEKKGLLFASPDAVAKGIVKAIRKKKDVVYLPKFWWLIMTIVKHVPEGIFKKLKF